MKRKLLAVQPDSIDYLDVLDVTFADSFDEAKVKIEQAEFAGRPFDDLELPVYDRFAFEDFINWMKSTNRRYAFSIFGYRDTEEFIRIRDKARKDGFHFND